MAKKKEYTKAERIKKEKNRLNRIYKEIEKDTKSLVEGLIERAAYMRVTLEDYEKDINENGSVELFSQSAKTPPYERKRPVADLYNSMNTSYQKIIKQLSDLIIKTKPVSEGDDDGFDDFVNDRD